MIEKWYEVQRERGDVRQTDTETAVPISFCEEGLYGDGVERRRSGCHIEHKKWQLPRPDDRTIVPEPGNPPGALPPWITLARSLPDYQPL